MRAIETEDAPAPLGPYSQGIVDGDTVYVSGQGPADPDTREVLVDTVAEQTEQTLANVAAILEAAGTSLDNAVRATVYLMDMADYDEMNTVYGDTFTDPYPARTCVQVADLPAAIEVEIDVIATR